MALPAKEAAPQKPKHGSYLKCDTCPAPLVGTWASKEGGIVGSRDDDIYTCLRCAGLIPIGSVPIPQPWYIPFTFGAVVVPIIWGIGRWKGWW